MADSSETRELNFLLIGRTGEGKSATGNTILGKRMFTECSTTTSVTKDVVSKFTKFDNFPVKVVDCPGIMGTDMDSGEDKTAAALNMATALGMCNGHVDAFILVIKRDRFTDEKRKSLEALKEIFGNNFLQNLIIVVTCGDQFKDDMENEDCGDMSFKEWCSLESGAFKQLYDEFSDRFLLINNREKDPQKKEAQRREIIQLADNLREQNGRYTSQSFEEAKAARDKLIVQENLPMLNESLQKKVGLLVADLLKLKEAPSDRERKSILLSIYDLMNEITEKDKGTGLLNNLMAKVEQVTIVLHDVDELHRLAMNIENIREAKSSWYSYASIVADYTTGVKFGTLVGATLLLPLPCASLTVLAGGAVSYGIGVWKERRCYRQIKELSQSEKQVKSEIDTLDEKVIKDAWNITK